MNQNFNKQHYKELKRFAKNDGIITASTPGTAWSGIVVNGISVAYQPMTNSTDNRMVAVSVSYCAPEDEYFRKVGKYNALCKFMNGESIQLPIGPYLREHGKDETSQMLLDLFSNPF